MRNALRADWQGGDAQSDLQALLRLTDNWNGMGASAVSDRTVTAAGRMLEDASRYSIPAPSVAAASDGGVALEWHVSARQLELEVLPDLSLEFAQFDSGSLVGEGVIGSADDPEATRLFRWLVQG